MVTPSGNYFGNITITKTDLSFVSLYDTEACKAAADLAAVNLDGKRRHKRRRWMLSAIYAIYRRRYRLRETACELFFNSGKHRSVFFSFGSSKSDVTLRNNCLHILMERCPKSAFRHKLSMSASHLVSEHSVQEKWVSGELSNFDYIMALNTLSGRSFNDLCQYPIFPWVLQVPSCHPLTCRFPFDELVDFLTTASTSLQDYTSSSIDLRDEAVYRDLSKPMGALNQDRLEQYIDRFFP